MPLPETVTGKNIELPEIGIDEAGVSRLPALDARGIAAATVSAAGARIGDARSTYEDGVLSRVNTRAVPFAEG